MRLSKDRQITSAVIRVGRNCTMEARTDFSPAGLLATGAMVTGILLGSAVIVAAARHRRKGGPKRIEAGPAARTE